MASLSFTYSLAHSISHTLTFTLAYISVNILTVFSVNVKWLNYTDGCRHNNIYKNKNNNNDHQTNKQTNSRSPLLTTVYTIHICIVYSVWHFGEAYRRSTSHLFSRCHRKKTNFTRRIFCVGNCDLFTGWVGERKLWLPLNSPSVLAFHSFRKIAHKRRIIVRIVVAELTSFWLTVCVCSV